VDNKETKVRRAANFKPGKYNNGFISTQGFTDLQIYFQDIPQFKKAKHDDNINKKVLNMINFRDMVFKICPK